MRYYSTNRQSAAVGLNEAVIRGLAADRGLYMPEKIKRLPDNFFNNIQNLSFQEISFEVAKAFFAEDVDEEALKKIVYDTLSFDCPIVNVCENIWSLELFHGPTLAFKDIGARFMARLLGYFIRKEDDKPVNVLVATSGDTGSAVANGFVDVEGINVYVLYPKDKVSKIQECQFATIGRNITAIEIDGVFDDCQALVKNAFTDNDLNARMRLTSANSINVARLIPQTFYYFNAYAKMKAKGLDDNLVICVPSGNFGNITAGLFTQKMGLPIKHFIAANNANDIFYNYLKTGIYEPKNSVQTIANAMDVGNPSNFARIYDLYGGSYKEILSHVSGAAFSDENISKAIAQCHKDNGYILDPHGACGYQALKEGLKEGETGVFCETAHPAKFKETVESMIRTNIVIPERLAEFMKGTKHTVRMSKEYSDFRSFLNSR